MIMRIAALTAFLAAPAAVQANCRPVEEVKAFLEGRFGEAVVAYGVMDTGNLVQIWANLSTGTFTAVVSDGVFSCITANGGDFALLDGKPNL
jgi:hypothetical protein